LGVCDVLERTSIVRGIVEPTVVVGFDGIAAVRRKIKDQDLWLLNTVDVKVRDQVRQLVAAFGEALTHHGRISNLNPVEGALVGGDQAAHVEMILKRRRNPTARPKRGAFSAAAGEARF
jgi:hypothetical protein